MVPIVIQTELNMTAMFRTDVIEFTGEIEINIDDQSAHPHASPVGEGWGEDQILTLEHDLARHSPHHPESR